MNTLVAVGAGFIGSAVVDHLMQRGEDELVVVDSFTYAANPESFRLLDGQRAFD